MSAAALLRDRSALVFDLDGTLVDSIGDITHTLSLALAECGLDPLAAGTIDLHSPFELIVRGVVIAAGASEDVAGEKADAVVRAYRHRIGLTAFERSAPYPGVVAYLRECMNRGKALAVCTNKRRSEALRMLAHFDMLEFFDVVVGADSAAHAKPDPAPLRMVLEAVGTQPWDAVLVGDTHVDALCALNGGVPFVWHTRGYGGQVAADQAMAARFDSFQDLLALSAHH